MHIDWLFGLDDYFTGDDCFGDVSITNSVTGLGYCLEIMINWSQRAYRKGVGLGKWFFGDLDVLGRFVNCC